MSICGNRLTINVLTDPFTFDDHDTHRLLSTMLNRFAPWCHQQRSP